RPLAPRWIPPAASAPKDCGRTVGYRPPAALFRPASAPDIGGSASRSHLHPCDRPNKLARHAKPRRPRRRQVVRRCRAKRWTIPESWRGSPRWRGAGGLSPRSAPWRAGNSAWRAALACTRWRAIHWDIRNGRREWLPSFATGRRLLLGLEPGAWLFLLSRGAACKCAFVARGV